jgi:hypothetical protein
VLERLKQLTNNAKILNQTQLLIEVFTNVKVKDEITDYITIEQLFIEGEDGLGEKLEEYSTFTKLKKQRSGDRFEVTTLNDTGQFYNSFDVRVNGNQISVYANDIHDLTTRYGKNILTLSNEGIETIKPKVIEIAKRYIIETIFKQ